MIFSELKLKGAFLVEVKKIEDDRGFFGRAWCSEEFRQHGINMDIQQINIVHHIQDTYQVLQSHSI